MRVGRGEGGRRGEIELGRGGRKVREGRGGRGRARVVGGRESKIFSSWSLARPAAWVSVSGW